MMHRILSICNFNSAIVITALLIVCIEIVSSTLLPARLFNHEIDEILYEIKTKPLQADYIILADSVGRQIIKGLEEYEKDKKFSMLASNAAIEMTGQYFLVKRFLVKNPSPKAIIFVGLPEFINRNLEQDFTENYVLRTFNDFDEIIELLKVKKNIIQTAKSICYKLFPSFKYRLCIQKKILSISNADIYTGVRIKSGNAIPSKYSLGNFIKKFQGQKVSLYHFRKLIELLTYKGIKFYYIPVPIKKQKPTNQLPKDYINLFKLLTSWKNEGMNIIFYNNIVEFPGDKFEEDQVHLNEEGLKEAKSYIDGFIKRATSI